MEDSTLLAPRYRSGLGLSLQHGTGARVRTGPWSRCEKIQLRLVLKHARQMASAHYVAVTHWRNLLSYAYLR